MQHAANAYTKVARTALSPREAEAAVLLKASTRLQSLREEAVPGSRALNEALAFNQKVWTVLSSGVNEPANAVPEEIRTGVNRLAIFVFRTILDTMVDPSARKLDTLVALNNHLAAGLRGDPGPAV